MLLMLVPEMYMLTSNMGGWSIISQRCFSLAEMSQTIYHPTMILAYSFVMRGVCLHLIVVR